MGLRIIEALRKLFRRPAQQERAPMRRIGDFIIPHDGVVLTSHWEPEDLLLRTGLCKWGRWPIYEHADVVAWRYWLIYHPRGEPERPFWVRFHMFCWGETAADPRVPHTRPEFAVAEVSLGEAVREYFTG